MSLEILEEKEAIREVIDRFSNLECDVPAQQALFTKDAHIMVHMGGILAMDIHGSEEMRNQFEGFTKTVKASHHMNGQQVIEIEGSTATDTHYCRAALITEENGKTYITTTTSATSTPSSKKKAHGKYPSATSTSSS